MDANTPITLTLPVGVVQTILNVFDEVAMPRKVSSPVIDAIVPQAKQQLAALQEAQTAAAAGQASAPVEPNVKKAVAAAAIAKHLTPARRANGKRPRA